MIFVLIRVQFRTNATSLTSEKVVLSLNDNINNDESSKLKEKVECRMYECHPDKIYLIVGKYFSSS